MPNWSIIKDQAENLVIPFLSPAFIYFFAKFALEFATRTHIVLGGFIAALLCVFAVRITRRPAHKRLPTSIVLGEFLTAVVIACVACAWVSYTIYQLSEWKYRVSAKASFSTFIDFYGWLFIDLIPGFDVWETLGVQPKVASVGIIAGIPVLAFRAFIIVCVVASVKRWWSDRKATQQLVGPEARA